MSVFQIVSFISVTSLLKIKLLLLSLPQTLERVQFMVFRCFLLFLGTLIRHGYPKQLNPTLMLVGVFYLERYGLSKQHYFSIFMHLCIINIYHFHFQLCPQPQEPFLFGYLTSFDFLATLCLSVV